MTERKYEPDSEGKVYMATIRPRVLVEYAKIIDDYFDQGEVYKGPALVKWAIQGIAKDREISPFLQARLLIDAGGISDDELEQLYELIGKELGK